LVNGKAACEVRSQFAGIIPESAMWLGFANAEMFIYPALERCVQLVGAVEMRSGLDVLSLKAEPNAHVPVVHL
jgi:hypothetical protein